MFERHEPSTTHMPTRDALCESMATLLDRQLFARPSDALLLGSDPAWVVQWIEGQVPHLLMLMTPGVAEAICGGAISAQKLASACADPRAFFDLPATPAPRIGGAISWPDDVSNDILRVITNATVGRDVSRLDIVLEDGEREMGHVTLLADLAPPRPAPKKSSKRRR